MVEQLIVLHCQHVLEWKRMNSSKTFGTAFEYLEFSSELPHSLSVVIRKTGDLQYFSQ